MTSSCDGRPRSCPMQIMVGGSVWRYQTGLTTGNPIYALECGTAAMLARLEAEQ